MAFVITRPCCNDASCVSVCPVNCIHPTPEEPEFRTAEMLYIDPQTCIDCGACVDACPVGAIFPDDELAEEDEPYLRLNADYYLDHDVAAGAPKPERTPRLPDGQVRVAVVGAGPAALYAAEELARHTQIQVDVFDRLPTPHGLVRGGVAPDHAATKGVERTFASTARKKNFRYRLGVEVGTDISHDELVERYHAVLYASGASTDKRLGIAGESLPGSVAATDFVAWYNGHPDHADDVYDLSSERAVVIGNGNVALDVARILLTDPDELASTDIAQHALDALRSSAIREVVVLGRRSIADGAYTNSEFLAMSLVDGVDVVIDADDLTVSTPVADQIANGTVDSTVGSKVRLAREYGERDTGGRARRVVLRYLTSPIRMVGDDAVTGVRVVRNEFEADSDRVRSTGAESDIAAGLVIRSIGYRGTEVDGLPFDPDTGTVPNETGRVLGEDGTPIPGHYVAGWLKRGATGGIGINRFCGQETARAVLEDVGAGVLPTPTGTPDDVEELLTSRGVQVVDADGWAAIDRAERAKGRATSTPRRKIVTLAGLLEAAQQ
ncbi:FAD-dependent oxidoreductase [Gordonia hydrophobica]|uniref:ferredoxin--NADP(+) reductase n=1 Tax=Gordonia hydrophobica TaxID=40516 RepID=A0ABZ2TWB0_9ACTN|nr:FAD-dependent oxidoreductase [Gordonia hydrophobica]MBM7365817.1 ferredoxin--NADP+ reductase [Gordonia hydrophobica]